MRRILVTGSRTWTDRQVIREALQQAVKDVGEQHDDYDIVLVHGGASGADRMAELEWQLSGLLSEKHVPNWNPYGIFNAHAGHDRNQKMVRLGADICLAFIRDNSSGASDCARRAEAAGIPVRYFRESSDVR